MSSSSKAKICRSIVTIVGIHVDNLFTACEKSSKGSTNTFKWIPGQIKDYHCLGSGTRPGARSNSLHSRQHSTATFLINEGWWIKLGKWPQWSPYGSVLIFCRQSDESRMRNQAQKGTMPQRILWKKHMISNNLPYGLIEYLDGNYTGDLENHKPVMGDYFFANRVIKTWSSRRQQTVSTAANEAKY